MKALEALNAEIIKQKETLDSLEALKESIEREELSTANFASLVKILDSRLQTNQAQHRVDYVPVK